MTVGRAGHHRVSAVAGRASIRGHRRRRGFIDVFNLGIAFLGHFG